MKKIIIEHDSSVLEMRKKLICIIPNNVSNETLCLTLLHGLGENENTLLDYTNIFAIAEKNNLIVLLPSADRSFYTNSLNGLNYFDYINNEIYDIVNETLNIDFNNLKHYIGGFSMGGYGAIKIALKSSRYSGVFSLTGPLDIVDADKQVKNGIKYMKLNEWQAIFGENIKDEENILKMSIKLPKVLISVGKNDMLVEHSKKFKEVYGDQCELILTEKGAHDLFFASDNIESIIEKLIS